MISPSGLSVLVIDYNRTCLLVMEKMLQKCRYKVTTCTSATAALSLLHKNKTSFDVVLCDVRMPEKDGFEFLKELDPEIDVPVVMMSSDDETDVVMQGIECGAAAFLVKPIHINVIRNLWQHPFRKKMQTDQNPTVNETKKQTKKRKGRENDGNETDTVEKPQKKRVKWSPDLEEKFLKVAAELGINNASPKKILELMKVDNLNTGNVASHLQKIRNCVKEYMTDGRTGRLPPQVLRIFSSQMSSTLKASDLFRSLPLNSHLSAATEWRNNCSDTNQVSMFTVQPLHSLPSNLNEECKSIVPYDVPEMNNYSSPESAESSVLDVIPSNEPVMPDFEDFQSSGNELVVSEEDINYSDGFADWCCVDEASFFEDNMNNYCDFLNKDTLDTELDELMSYISRTSPDSPFLYC